MTTLTFPSGFLWGAATSAYQIEGAWDLAGKGASIWDQFTHRPFMIADGTTGDQAADHFHLMHDDVALIKELGLQSYRFSISWPRVLPEGRGRANEVGLDFYDRLVDALLAAGIQPNATLNHWDIPQALQEIGGWSNRDSAGWFTEYAALMFDRLGDRVPLWTTHNEPWVIAFLGYAYGIHAPGLSDCSLAYRAVHHLLLCHGQAVEIYRGTGYKGQIGIVLNMEHFTAATDREADQAARRRVYDENVALFMEPLYKKQYPAELLAWVGRHAPPIKAGDLDVIAAPTDFLGLNYYHANRISFNIHGGLLKADRHPLSSPGWSRTEMGWGVYPPGLTAVLQDLMENYGNPDIYIAENGCALVDEPDEAGYVADWGRIAYLRDHFRAAHEAIEAGVNLRGYYVWSLLDNFEWERGHGPRFGLVRVDFATRRRIPKESARWYGQVIGRNGVVI